MRGDRFTSRLTGLNDERLATSYFRHGCGDLVSSFLPAFDRRSDNTYMIIFSMERLSSASSRWLSGNSLTASMIASAASLLWEINQMLSVTSRSLNLRSFETTITSGGGHSTVRCRPVHNTCGGLSNQFPLWATYPGTCEPSHPDRSQV